MNVEIRLRELREARGLSYRKLAQLSEVSLSQIQKIESGFAKYPRIYTLCQLAEALSVSLDELIQHNN